MDTNNQPVNAGTGEENFAEMFEKSISKSRAVSSPARWSRR